MTDTDDEERCNDCGRETDVTTAITCSFGDHPVCTECVVTCAKCGEVGCRECGAECERTDLWVCDGCCPNPCNVCGRRAFEDEPVSCALCNTWLCADDDDCSERCAECERALCLDCVAFRTLGDEPCCGECTRPPCRQCGAAVALDGLMIRQCASRLACKGFDDGVVCPECHPKPPTHRDGKMEGVCEHCIPSRPSTPTHRSKLRKVFSARAARQNVSRTRKNSGLKSTAARHPSRANSE